MHANDLSRALINFRDTINQKRGNEKERAKEAQEKKNELYNKY